MKLRLSIFILILTYAPIHSEFELDVIQDTYPDHKSLKPSKKPWTIIIYMAADNDLRGFAARNIKQMAALGSNANINIIAELHIRLSGNKKITRRYFIEQGKIIHLNANDASSQKMDSGDHQTLISCCSFAMKNYPADNYALIFWNHGTGIVDPVPGKIVHATELFSFNSTTNRLELDRSIGFLDFISHYNQGRRGICWDDSTGNYLTNQKLVNALHHVCNECNEGKKFALIGFDACLMSMIEVADLIKNYAEFMVSSQEVELGTGWNYQLVLSQFKEKSPTPLDFAQHIVAMYENTYNKVTTDYTLSAINLAKIDLLTANIDSVSRLLLDGLHQKENARARSIIKLSRDRTRCTHFDEPSYIDLHHFYTNLQAHNEQIPTTNSLAHDMRHKLTQALHEGRGILKDLVVANVTSKNLARASGLSIYFPERRLHFSYEKTPFANNNEWINLMHQYLLT